MVMFLDRFRVKVRDGAWVLFMVRIMLRISGRSELGLGLELRLW